MRNIPLDTVLKTIRLRLRAVSFSDIDLVWSASRISGFNSGMVWDPPQTKEELIPITEKNLAAWIEGVSYTFTIDLHETKTPVGRVAIRYIDNKRFTMRDIGKMDKRLKTMEYFTSLSLLEQSAAATQIRDTNKKFFFLSTCLGILLSSKIIKVC